MKQWPTVLAQILTPEMVNQRIQLQAINLTIEIGLVLDRSY